MLRKKKTKIIATIGPVSESEEVLTKLVEAGLNVIRLNFSHGDYAEHQKRVDNFRKVAQKTGRALAIMQDLSGPKIRIGGFYQERVVLTAGETFTLTTEEIVGDEHKAFINYPTLCEEVLVGSPVLLDDGKKRLEVVEIKGRDVVCKIIVGGETKGKRGVNLPGANLKISSITEKDKKDLEFGIKNKVDFIALSFVRRPEDILELREMLDKAKSDASIIAKIETQEAVENMDEIIKLADGIMVARGDLAIEVPAETVPMIQKKLIKKSNVAGKPVITATQMLESMINSPVPTRAEVSDVANAILDGTDAVMLSEETTLGKYPVEAVKVMSKVALQIEKEYPEKYEINGIRAKDHLEVVDSITSSVVKTSHDIGAKIIFAFTESGFTARMISRHKPYPLVICLSPKKETCNKLALSFGCYPIEIKRSESVDEAMVVIRKFCLENKLAQKGDKVVISAGVPFNTDSIPTNMMLVEEI